ncbi:uncharacterized protein K460DRAFT_317168 [Cucurbitaria berberidis CBS 394.84]|uniref:Cell wall protein PhiA n=1 Tax=Cucurbitaria berberidis CBS 394.84 TaxID=1168544 RepID=A0A9P4GEF7_9PLEO|nr:uncharacterized protein K460DRAFT_317168 [Cucurbitaria berberidis CBS 394.84]KAF1844050.1 hypothetical protein K460DRAFT_317168 [Cucurbitaria berberidis CBS 394.84]
MKFTTAAIAASAAAVVSASPVAQTSNEHDIKDGGVFRIMAIRSGSDIHYSSIQAANGALYINTPSQNASCSQPVNYASFRLASGELYLNARSPPQQLYVDRSAMGQGVVQYTTGAQGAGKNAERTGFTIDDNSNLVFGQNTGFLACPDAPQGGYTVWLNINERPGGNQNCVGFAAKALKEDAPVDCSYTERS